MHNMPVTALKIDSIIAFMQNMTTTDFDSISKTIVKASRATTEPVLKFPIKSIKSAFFQAFRWQPYFVCFKKKDEGSV